MKQNQRDEVEADILDAYRYVLGGLFGDVCDALTSAIDVFVSDRYGRYFAQSFSLDGLPQCFPEIITASSFIIFYSNSSGRLVDLCNEQLQKWILAKQSQRFFVPEAV